MIFINEEEMLTKSMLEEQALTYILIGAPLDRGSGMSPVAEGQGCTVMANGISPSSEPVWGTRG